MEERRPSAEEMLERVRRQAGSGSRGRLKIYLGMAAGVGKTYAALMELHRRKSRGTDCVVGWVETHGRPKTLEALRGLEVVPPRRCEYKGRMVEEMDTEAIIRRRPAVALVDELAHTNVPGCARHEKRWQEVQDILDHGITVISTLNVQHIESFADLVEDITGSPVRERVPDWVVDQADELELVDMSPHSLRQRIRHGNVYPPEQVEAALRGFFREGNLSALRELALRKMAERAEQDLEAYMRQHDIEQIWPVGDKVLVAIDAHPRSRILIQRGWRRAQRYGTDLLVAFVETPAWARASPEARRQLAQLLQYAEDLGAKCLRSQGQDIAAQLLELAKEHNVGTVVLGRPRGSRWRHLLRGSVPERLLWKAKDIDLIIVADQAEQD
ncbi:osmosensitive K channel signal transduction histidine kinase, sensor subunit KdpD [Thermobaculum terrenum ATCC BAA-798]|uniref:Osmosensitive K channel signal transduction histidine kinase, sensor subunit KdpD n=2 Tax=Thermobaculum TaxID=262406 RepID=D1CGX0_THET1|nr:osmosensitive K channel signal transduction histidine kinase, sensor subunit KdpD [Thermobaculum terrenum ATCC BAA-798]